MRLMILRWLAAGWVVVSVVSQASGAAARDVSSRVAQEPARASHGDVAGSDPDDPKQAGKFAGRVLGPDARPVEGAKIFIIPDDAKLKSIGPVRAVSDGDGRFFFDAADMTFRGLDGLPARRQGFLFAIHERYAPDWIKTWGYDTATLQLFNRPVKQAEYTFRLGKNDVTIHGRFVDSEGRRLVGARVRLVSLMVPSEFDLNAYLEGELQSKSRDSINYERYLTQPQLLPGATVETFTDDTGRFVMSGLGRDRVAVVKVSAPRVVDTTLTVMTRLGRDVETRPDQNGKPTQTVHGAGFILELKAGRTVTGVVRDRETQKGISGVWVGSARERIADLSEGEHAWATDKEGRFTIGGLDPSASPLEIMAVPQAGALYPITSVSVDETSEVVIEPERGIPFRLKVTDEHGESPLAEVSYHVVIPNPQVREPLGFRQGAVINFAARRPDGTYEGFVLPGPGAVLVRLPDRSDYRPAHVDPKAFFAPGRTEWNAQDLVSTYGNHDTLSIYPGWWLDQHDYAAIVLVNPPGNSGPLELMASVSHDEPRQISLVDPDDKPVVGATSEGLTFYPWDREPQLRGSSFPVRRLHPDRLRRITFFQEERKLIGFLGARGDGEAPYRVRMERWGTVSGRIVDEKGNAVPSAYLSMGGWRGTVTQSDLTVGEHRGVQTDDQGRFRLEQLVPGLRYTAAIYRGVGMFAGNAFENLVLKAGEVKELGEIRSKAPVNVRGR